MAGNGKEQTIDVGDEIQKGLGKAQKDMVTGAMKKAQKAIQDSIDPPWYKKYAPHAILAIAGIAIGSIFTSKVEREVKVEVEKPVIYPVFNDANSVMLRENVQTGKLELSAPIEYFHRDREADIKDKLIYARSVAQNFSASTSGVIALDGNNDWALADRARTPDITVQIDFSDLSMLDDKYLDEIIQGIQTAQKDAPNYVSKNSEGQLQSTRLGYAFSFKAAQPAANGQPATPAKVTVVSDIARDGAQLNGGNDMKNVFSADLS